MTGEPPIERSGRRWIGITAVGLTLLALLLAVVIASGVLTRVAPASQGDSAGSRPGEDSVDAGFLRDMQVHHAQAVEMSVIVRDRTADAAVRTIGLDIELTQQQQIGQMFALLASWGLPQSSSEAPMAWMRQGGSEGGSPSHDMSDMDMSDDSMGGAVMSMPGMASEEDLRTLRRLSGTAAERLFLQLMIEHHQGGLGMAEFAQNRATDGQVRMLARSIVESQTPEIEVLEQMLADRGGPLPDGSL